MEENTKRLLRQFPYVKETETGDILIMDKSRYSLDENYKISFRNHRTTQIEHFYTLDFNKLVEEGHLEILGLNPFEAAHGAEV